MGSGSRAYRIAMGTATAESQAMRTHQLAMIPILQKQAEMELGIQEKQAEMELGLQEKKYEMELAQTEKINLLAQKLTPETPDPIMLPAKVTPDEPDNNKFLLIAGLAVLAYMFLRK